MAYCKNCEKEFIIKENIVTKKGCCSYKCYRVFYKREIRSKYLTTFIENNFKKLDYKNLTLKEKESIYSLFQSKKTQISTIKKHDTIIKKYGSITNGYRKSSTKGNKNRKINFLLKNSIVTKEELINCDEKYINDLFIKYFNKIEGHGGKVKKGRLRKHREKYKEAYRNGLIKTALNYLNYKNSNIEDYNEKEINIILKKYYKDIKFYNHDCISWKKTHLINANILNIDDVKKTSDKSINRLYSEYISKRFKRRSLEVENNGYKRTKKGWYEFKNIDKNLFYRSSWEEYIFSIIDNLIKEKHIIEVGNPDRIRYFFEGKYRYYYPDVKIRTNYKELTIEIKPYRKLKEKMNKKKIKESKKQLGSSFLVLTEKEIFSDNIVTIILKGKI